ncbi:MAG: hypothetical protein Hals2KO_21370 [Halioglobus sp.]
MLGKPAALRRFIPDTPPEPNRDRERAEIARQTAEFLARGGEINVIQGSEAVNPVYGYGLAPAKDSKGRNISVPPREVKDGRAIVRLSGLLRLLETSNVKARKISRRPGFPSRIPGEIPDAWVEDEVLAWKESNS